MREKMPAAGSRGARVHHICWNFATGGNSGLYLFEHFSAFFAQGGNRPALRAVPWQPVVKVQIAQKTPQGLGPAVSYQAFAARLKRLRNNSHEMAKLPEN